MKKNTYLLFGACLVLILFIFLFVPTKTKNKTSSNANLSNTIYTLTKYKEDFYINQPDSIKLVIRTIDEKLSKASDSLDKLKIYSESIDFYNKIQSPENASLAVYEKAKLVNNTNSWKVTGDNFISLLSDQKLDTSLINDVLSYATKSYEKSISLDSNNTDSKIQLAQLYMEVNGQTMNGVQMLLGIVRKDSTNVKAQLLLAKFGLVSGQFEKVLQRLENVLSLQPENIDALLMRAEAYAQTGKTKLAANDLRKVKTNSKTPQEMKTQLEVAIKELEKKQ